MSKFIEPIATIHNDYTSKFAIPRQSGISENILSTIIFEPKYRCDEAIRGISEFSHLWLIWDFSKADNSNWSPTVRPPRLGGNKRVGVFATRSPFRPNGLGLSLVSLRDVIKDRENGSMLIIGGADLLNGTPVYDIKPYLPNIEIKRDAIGGFTENIDYPELEVVIEPHICHDISDDLVNKLKVILSQDPRPSYHSDAYRVYGFSFADMEIRFKVNGNILTVVDINKN